MSLIAFVAVCAAGAFAAIAIGEWRSARRVARVLAVLAALIAALLLRPGETTTVGEVRLVVSWYEGVLLTAGLAGCLLLSLVAVASGDRWQFEAPALATFGLFGVALAATSPGVALLAGAAAAAPALALVGGAAADDRSRVALVEFRIVALIGSAAALAAVCAMAAGWTSDVAAVVPAGAYLLLVAAIAVRLGAVPFHVPAAHAARQIGPLALPLLLVWIPAGLTAVALGWASGTSSVGMTRPDFATAPIVAIAVATLLLGAVGALLHADLAEIAAYSIVQDSGFLLLALSARPGTPDDGARLWLLCFVVAKTALVAWVAAAGAAFGTRRLDELSGWARRQPILAVALVAAALATIGWPGIAVFQARADLVDHAVGGPLRYAGTIAAVLSVAVYGRLLFAGVLGDSPRIAATRPATTHRIAPEQTSLDEVADQPAEPGETAGAAGHTRVRARAGLDATRLRLARLADVAARYRRDTSTAAYARGSLVLVCALCALGVAAGAFGVTRASNSNWVLVVSATPAPTLAPAPGASGSGQLVPGGVDTDIPSGAIPPDALPTGAAAPSSATSGDAGTDVSGSPTTTPSSSAQPSGSAAEPSPSATAAPTGS